MINTVLLVCSAIEFLLIISIFLFFFRLKKSESYILLLKKKQKEILDKLRFNQELEKKLIESFESRQKELIFLDKKLKEKIEELKALIKYADDISTSPHFLKEIVLRAYRKGTTIKDICKKTGLSEEEIELIIDQNN